MRGISEWARGDAYRAIALLRECAKTIEFNKNHVIDREFVGGISDGFTPPPHGLGTHERLWYELIKETGTIAGSKLKRQYVDRSSNPRGDTMRQYYLKTLEERGLITATGSGRGKRYQFEGR